MTRTTTCRPELFCELGFTRAHPPGSDGPSQLRTGLLVCRPQFPFSAR